jgi:hypothetical protein
MGILPDAEGSHKPYPGPPESGQRQENAHRAPIWKTAKPGFEEF